MNVVGAVVVPEVACRWHRLVLQNCELVTSEVISFHVITNRQINIIATTAQKRIHKRRSSISMIDKYISVFHKYYERVCVRSCVCAYVHAFKRACVRACMRLNVYLDKDICTSVCMSV